MGSYRINRGLTYPNRGVTYGQADTGVAGDARNCEAGR